MKIGFLFVTILILAEADFLQLFADDQRPVVRVVLDVVDEEEEKED